MVKLVTKRLKTRRRTSPSKTERITHSLLHTNDNENSQQSCFDNNAGRAIDLFKWWLSCVNHTWPCGGVIEKFILNQQQFLEGRKVQSALFTFTFLKSNTCVALVSIQWKRSMLLFIYSLFEFSLCFYATVGTNGINKLVHSYPLRLLAVCFFSRNFSRDYEETLFSLKENGTRHGRGTDEKKNRLQTLLMFLKIFTPVKII